MNEKRTLVDVVRTAADSELFVNSLVHLQLVQTDWGMMLSSAPNALGCLGQCFVLASDPMAALLSFPETSRLPRKTLRGNLSHCSELGLASFRVAESRMRKVSIAADGICESGGVIDSIIQATEDEDLAELDLPYRLETLNRVSQDCIANTKAIKESVEAWGKFANDIREACVDKNDSLHKTTHDLGDRIQNKELMLKMKRVQLSGTRAQTNEYRSQLASRQKEMDESRRSYSNGSWIDMAHEALAGAIQIELAMLNPANLILDSSGGDEGEDDQGWHIPEEGESTSQDGGYVFANELLPLIHRLSDILCQGPEDLGGVNWETLAGRREDARIDAIGNIQWRVKEIMRRNREENSKTAWQVRDEMKPVVQVVSAIQDVVRKERNVAEKTNEVVAQSAKQWQSDVQSTKDGLGKIVGSGAELDKRKEAEMRKKKQQMPTGKTSRAVIRFQRLREAQQALFDAEARLNQQLKDELRDQAEFDAMGWKHKELLNSELTLSEVKKVVGECAHHLQKFCDRIDEVMAFFTQIQDCVQDLGENRVRDVGHAAKLAQKLRERSKSRATEAEKRALEKLEEFRYKALQLKGQYRVVQAMASMYGEVSKKYIIPAVKSVDRLSAPSSTDLSQRERAAMVDEVQELAKRARKNIKLLADARKDQLLMDMVDQRGVAEEVTW